MPKRFCRVDDCEKRVFLKGCCRQHYDNTCKIDSCENKCDSYGDGCCTKHAKSFGRPICFKVGCEDAVWKKKRFYCKLHDKCKKCNTLVYKDDFCRIHHPLTINCSHVITKRCSGRRINDSGFCPKHSGIIGKNIGRCKFVTIKKCCLTPKKGHKFCTRHAKLYLDQKESG